MRKRYALFKEQRQGMAYAEYSMLPARRTPLDQGSVAEGGGRTHEKTKLNGSSCGLS
jgi:hypothetical protein